MALTAEARFLDGVLHEIGAHIDELHKRMSAQDYAAEQERGRAIARAFDAVEAGVP
jgi:hypothetical protein